MKNIFGLIGYPLSHSFSASYFKNKFVASNIKDCEYKNFAIENILKIKELLKNETNLIGFNITIPYKQAIIPFLDYKNEVVEQIGACNCVKIKNRKLYGFNTDVVGFEISLKKILPLSQVQDALILGTGGAAKAVEYVFKKNNIPFKYVSRKQNKNILTYENLNEQIIKNVTIIVNTSPLGMFPLVNEKPNIPYSFLGANHICYDLIYNPEKTLFLQQAESQNATIKNGYEMLLLQAEESWRIWNEE